MLVFLAPYENRLSVLHVDEMREADKPHQFATVYRRKMHRRKSEYDRRQKVYDAASKWQVD